MYESLMENLFSRDTLIIALFSFLCGVVLAMGIKYPLTVKNIDELQVVCVGSGIEKIKVGITGKIHEVECANRTIFNFK